MAERLLNVIPSDVGRPIAQINPNIVCPNLAELITETIERVAPIEREVQDRDGHWHALRIRPYKNLDNRIEGAVLAVLDLESDQRHGRQVERAGVTLGPVLDALDLPVMVLDADLRIRVASSAASRSLRVEPDMLTNRIFTELDGTRSAGEVLRPLLHGDASGDGAARQFTIDVGAPREGQRQIIATARRVELERGRDSLVLLLRDASHETTEDQKTGA
jgi:two-component system, chemotaxis family, CheB/CheR fusion protein